jgi:hypothetical protein
LSFSQDYLIDHKNKITAKSDGSWHQKVTFDTFAMNKVKKMTTEKRLKITDLTLDINVIGFYIFSSLFGIISLISKLILQQCHMGCDNIITYDGF